MEVKPMIRQEKVREYTEDICPHCNELIGEKALYLIDQDDSVPWEKKRWQHRSCGGEILMPVVESPFAIEQLFSTAKKVTASDKTRIVRYLRFADKLDSKGLFKQANQIAKAFEISDRYTALGIPHPDIDIMCDSYCEGTGWIPVYMHKGDPKYGEEDHAYGEDEKDPVLVKSWEDAEEAEASDDGYHFVKCPDCNGSRKRKINDKVFYEKYLFMTPQEMPGLQYYILHIPIDAIPPNEGQKLTLRGNPVVVQSVRTPEDIAKGRGGPVARSMEANGIGWKVNCLPEGHEWLKG